MENQNQEVKTSKNKVAQVAKNALAATGVALLTIAPAFAAGDAVSIDLATAVTGVAILGGLMAAGALKAVPTYAGWGIKKALAMLR